MTTTAKLKLTMIVLTAMCPQDICQFLESDETRQTASDPDMTRLHYQECLLDFEAYVTSGRYAAEIAKGAAPSSQRALRYHPSHEREAVALLAGKVAQVTAAGGTQGPERRQKRGRATAVR